MSIVAFETKYALDVIKIIEIIATIFSFVRFLGVEGYFKF